MLNLHRLRSKRRHSGDGVSWMPLALSSGVVCGASMLGLGLAGKYSGKCQEVAKLVEDTYPGFSGKPKGLARIFHAE